MCYKRSLCHLRSTHSPALPQALPQRTPIPHHMPFDEELLRDWVNKELDNDDTLLQSRDLGQMTLVHDPSGSHSAYSQRYVLVRDSDPGRPANFRGFFQTVKDRTKMSMYGDGIDRKNVRVFLMCTLGRC